MYYTYIISINIKFFKHFYMFWITILYSFLLSFYENFFILYFVFICYMLFNFAPDNFFLLSNVWYSYYHICFHSIEIEVVSRLFIDDKTIWETHNLILETSLLIHWKFFMYATFFLTFRLSIFILIDLIILWEDFLLF